MKNSIAILILLLGSLGILNAQNMDDNLKGYTDMKVTVKLEDHKPFILGNYEYGYKEINTEKTLSHVLFKLREAGFRANPVDLMDLSNYTRVYLNHGKGIGSSGEPYVTYGWRIHVYEIVCEKEVITWELIQTDRTLAGPTAHISHSTIDLCLEDLDKMLDTFIDRVKTQN